MRLSLFLIVSLVLQTADASRLVDNGNDTVTDRTNGLMWAKAASATTLSHDAARQYSQRFRGGGFEDWRLPTVEELGGLFDDQQCRVVRCRNNQWTVCLPPLIQVSCPWVWSAEEGPGGSFATLLHFSNGEPRYGDPADASQMVALPVRSIK